MENLGEYMKVGKDVDLSFGLEAVVEVAKSKNIDLTGKIVTHSNRSHEVFIVDEKKMLELMDSKLYTRRQSEFNRLYSVNGDIHDVIDSGFIDVEAKAIMKCLDEGARKYFVELGELIEGKYLEWLKLSINDEFEVVPTTFISTSDKEWLNDIFKYSEQEMIGVPGDYLIENIELWMEETESSAERDIMLNFVYEFKEHLRNADNAWCIIERE